MAKMGRPKIPVDYETIDKLCAINCTAEEIEAYLNIKDKTISIPTIKRRIKEDFNMTFEQYIAQKANGTAKVSLRRAHYRLVSEGNVAMIIFLSKNLLGMSDKVQTEITGKDGGAIAIESPREDIERKLALIATRIEPDEPE